MVVIVDLPCLVLHHFLGDHFPDPSVSQKRYPVTEDVLFLKMRTDVQKRESFLCIMMQDLVKIFQFPVTDQGADLLQHNQMVARYHGAKQFHDDTLKYRQTLYFCLRCHLHANLF